VQESAKKCNKFQVSSRKWDFVLKIAGKCKKAEQRIQNTE